MTEPDVLDPAANFAVEPYPLRFRAGSAPGVSFRVRGPHVEMPAEGMTTTEAAIVRWKRVAVITGRKGSAPAAPPSYRFFALEWDPTVEEQRIDFEGFYVRGNFRVVLKENNARRARIAWEAFEPEAR